MTSNHEPFVSAEEWFAQGRRVPYDPFKKRVLNKERPGSVNVWERVVAPSEVSSSRRWLTMIPGVPDGSYTFSKVDTLLQTSPRLYVEFVGLGDSDKPNKYEHSVKDKANLVEAQWRAHKIRRTVLICQSCSSMVMMELLNRQSEQLRLGLPVRTRIEHVLCLNGAYFAHTHTPHPLNTCMVGKLALKLSQRADIVMDPIIKGCFSKEYKISKREVREISSVVRRRNGTNYFTGSGARYVEDHQAHAARWDLVNVYNVTRRQRVSFMFVAGAKDPFEHKSFALAKKLLDGQPDVYFETLPGGYALACEHPRRIAEMIDGIAISPAVAEDCVWGLPCDSPKLSSSTTSEGSTVSTEFASSLAVSERSDWADTEFPELFEFSL